MVGATLARSMYMFVVETTVEQDLHLIEQFNSLPNENHFNGMTRNCADFTRRVINAYFPGATGPDYINDFGMTSPKAIARSFTRYAKRHPEAHFRVLHFAQIPGTIKRSTVARAGTEQLFARKNCSFPCWFLRTTCCPLLPHPTLLTGRFNPQRELETHPTLESAELEHQIRLAKSEDNEARAEQLEAEKNQQSASLVGTGEEWKKYREEFNSMVAEEARQESIPERSSLNNSFSSSIKRELPWLITTEPCGWKFPTGKSSRVGLSRANSQSNSDPELALPIDAGTH